jgi:hypothetical protein
MPDLSKIAAARQRTAVWQLGFLRSQQFLGQLSAQGKRRMAGTSADEGCALAPGNFQQQGVPIVLGDDVS